MRPDVVVDIGNSRVKWGRVVDGRVAEAVSLNHDRAEWDRAAKLWGMKARSQWAVASVVPRAVSQFMVWLTARCMSETWIRNDLFFINHPFGFTTDVEEVDRIGIDRLLTALAAWRRTPPPASAVVLNVGTAMTIDFVEAPGLHRGGAILPGPRLMARSLHEHTAQLPAVDVDPEQVPTMPWGSNTEDAIALGIANAILGAADRMIRTWAGSQAVPPSVFVTGGDAGYFDGFTFTAKIGHFEIDPLLTLEGIRLAAEALP